VTELTYNKDGQVVASGTWEVSGGATGAMLEFRIDNERYQAETRTGTSGTWERPESRRLIGGFLDGPDHLQTR